MSNLFSNLISIDAGTPIPTKKEESKKASAQYWLNVGVEVNGEFLSLPVGIGLDGLEPRKIPHSSTQNQKFRNIRLAEKTLFDQIVAAASSLEPGESRLTTMTVQLYRVKSADTEGQNTVSEENPYLPGQLF